MLAQLGLRNFKSWETVDIKLSSLNVLFGTNSSGKSSILQALLLLVQTQEKTAWQNVNFGGDKTDYVNLGSFRDVVFNHDLRREIMIGADWWEGDWYTGKAAIQFLDNKVQFKLEGNLAEYIAHLDNPFNLSPRLTYLGPLREPPQRSYLWSGATPYQIEPDGENTIAVLVATERYGGDLQRQVASWLVKMDLADTFAIKALDPEKRFYETTVRIGNTESSLLDVGFGVSQVLPVITTLFFVPEGSIVLLEQPELHLHPRAQAHLADLFLHVAEHRKLQLIVESHSEHLLRRLQRRIAEVESQFASPENIKMYFCDKGENGSTIQPVEVDEYGQIRNWPDKFFGDITGDLEKMTLAALQRSRNGH